MITVVYFRFIIEPETKQEIKLDNVEKDNNPAHVHKIAKVMYHKEQDHCEYINDSIFLMQNAETRINKWLSEHMGMVVMHIDNRDEFDAPQERSFSNLKEFLQQFLLDPECPVVLEERKE